MICLFRSVWQALVVSVLLVMMLVNVQAQVMSSSNYQIQSDSVNAGGLLSSSTNYQVEATVGEIATGESNSTSYEIRAGYQQMQEVYLAISDAANIAMSSNISGVTGGTANGSTTVTVTTDNLAGYQLQIEAANNPAMQSGANTIADYSPAGAVPDYNFTYGASDALLGYTVDGSDVANKYLSSGSVCGSGSDEVDKCWEGLSTTAATIASAAGANHPNGTNTVVTFQVAIGGSVNQPAGTYVATTTLTALSL